MTKITDNFEQVRFKELGYGCICRVGKVGRDFYLKPAKNAKTEGYNCICINDGEFGYLDPDTVVAKVKELEVVAYG